MPPVHPSLDVMLDTARDVVAHPAFDRDTALEILATMPTDGLDVQMIGAIAHAKLVVLTGPKSARFATTARFALARVVDLLEKHQDRHRNRDSVGLAT